MKIGTRVALKADYFRDPGVIVGLRRSDDLYASGRPRKNGRGSLWAVVEWKTNGPRRGYSLSELVDLDAPQEGE